MKRFAMVAIALMIAASAMAVTVRVECHGEVEYNQINSGAFGAVNSGDAVFATFTIDSDDYNDSTNYGVRTYPINLASFELIIGSAGPIPLVMPQPNGETSYFNLRNADPVSDGFFIANNPESPNGFPALDEPANIDPYFGFHWSVGYTGDSSLIKWPTALPTAGCLLLLKMYPIEYSTRGYIQVSQSQPAKQHRSRRAK